MKPGCATRVHRARLIMRDKLADYFYEWKNNLHPFAWIYLQIDK
jgi:hypothetical protein